MFKPALVLHAATLPSSSPKLARPAAQLVTTTGSIYKNVEVERVMSDGIIISYTPAGGGSAMTRVNFEDLSPELRQRYEKK
jgi:cyclophilin family peptidyl-prolyl cis-trans isomerase